jgi:TolB protein
MAIHENGDNQNTRPPTELINKWVLAPIISIATLLAIWLKPVIAGASAAYIVLAILLGWRVYKYVREKRYFWAFLAAFFFLIATMVTFFWLGTLSRTTPTKPTSEPTPSQTGTKPLPLHTQIAIVGWEAWNQGQYRIAVSIADICINFYEQQARQQQAGLIARGITSLPIGYVNEDQRKEIEANGELNAVGACWWIKASSLEKLEHISEAIEAYKKTEQFHLARTWDQQKGYWSPADDARSKRSALSQPTATFSPEPPLVTPSPPVTMTPGTTITPTVSPTSSIRYDQLVYSARIGESDYYDLYLLDLQSNKKDWLTTSYCDGASDWSPDGNQLVFTSKEDGPYCQIYILTLPDKQVRPLTFSASNKVRPNWSPDGKYIVYVAQKWSDDDLDLFLLDLQAQSEVQLTDFPRMRSGDIVEIWDPKWSPDGKTIAFWSDLTFGGDHFEIYMLRFPQRTLPLTDPDVPFMWSTDSPSNPDNDEQFVWSPDGTRFAFINKLSADPLSSFDIWIGEFDSTGDTVRWPLRKGSLLRIPDYERVFDAGPAWSPDGTRVAFHRVTKGDSSSGPKDIFIYNIFTDKLENVTQTPDIDERWPAWRPYGR